MVILFFFFPQMRHVLGFFPNKVERCTLDLVLKLPSSLLVPCYNG